MVTTVRIETKEKPIYRGSVSYDDSKKKVTVVFPDKKIKQEIEKYLATKQDFRIPESQEIDDYRVDNAAPVDNQTYFELAMCTLYSKLGVWVDWNSERQEGKKMEEKKSDAKPDKEKTQSKKSDPKEQPKSAIAAVLRANKVLLTSGDGRVHMVHKGNSFSVSFRDPNGHTHSVAATVSQGPDKKPVWKIDHAEGAGVGSGKTIVPETEVASAIKQIFEKAKASKKLEDQNNTSAPSGIDFTGAPPERKQEKKKMEKSAGGSAYDRALVKALTGRDFSDLDHIVQGETFEKAHVKAYSRKDPRTGKLVQVAEHEDARAIALQNAEKASEKAWADKTVESHKAARDAHGNAAVEYEDGSEKHKYHKGEAWRHHLEVRALEKKEKEEKEAEVEKQGAKNPHPASKAAQKATNKARREKPYETHKSAKEAHEKAAGEFTFGSPQADHHNGRAHYHLNKIKTLRS